MPESNESNQALKKYEAPDRVQTFIESAMSSLSAGLAGSWNEAERLQVRSQTRFEELDEHDRAQLESVFEWLMCNLRVMRGVHATSEVELKEIIGYLDRNDALTDLIRRGQPEIGASLPAEYDLAMQLQRLGAMARLADLQGDSARAAALRQEQTATQARLISALPEDNPWRLFMKSNEVFARAVQSFGLANAAAGELDLAAANRFLEQTAAGIAETESLLSRAGEMPGFIRSVFEAMSGMRQSMLAVQRYTIVFEQIVTGQSMPEHARELDAASQQARLGMQQIRESKFNPQGLAGFEGFTGVFVARCANLKTIIERSGGASTRHVKLAPRVVLFFLLTFVLTMATFRLTGLVKEISLPMLVACAVIALVVSVIGAFAMDANRLIPLFKATGMRMPKVGADDAGTSKK
ncbi:MAG: hypothetical protein AB7G11_05155 [Phycisphaerales bacterium]